MSRKLPPPEDFVSEPIARASPDALPYRELICQTLEAIRQRDENKEMELRALIMGRFRRSESQINAALFKQLTLEEGGVSNASYGEVDMKTCEPMEWLVDGFIPAYDQTLLYGEAGAGKTSAAIALSFTVVDGVPILDREGKSRKGRVLFISSDSGKSPLLEAMERSGYATHEAVTDGRFTVWAHSRSEKRMAWDASVAGCLSLLDRVKTRTIDLVVMDSCKAVTSKADLDYTSNPQMTAMLTFFQEVICQYCAVLWLNHDGKEPGTHAGAKAWKEIPSCAHSIERVYPQDSKGRKLDQPVPGMRKWTVRKCRMGTERSFTYEIDPESGRLRLTPGSEDLIVGNCSDTLLQVLRESEQPSLSRQQLIEQCFAKGFSAKTVDNTVTDLVRRRVIVRPQRGLIALAPSQQKSSKGRGSEQEEEKKDPSDAMGSADFPAISQTPSAGITTFPASAHREISGNPPNSSRANGSGPISSRSPHHHAPQSETNDADWPSLGARVEAEVAPGQWESGLEVVGFNTDQSVRLRQISGARHGRTRCLMRDKIRPAA